MASAETPKNSARTRISAPPACWTICFTAAGGIKFVRASETLAIARVCFVEQDGKGPARLFKELAGYVCRQRTFKHAQSKPLRQVKRVDRITLIAPRSVQQGLRPGRRVW